MGKVKSKPLPTPDTNPIDGDEFIKNLNIQALKLGNFFIFSKNFSRYKDPQRGGMV